MISPLGNLNSLYAGGGVGYGEVSMRDGDSTLTYDGPRTNFRTVNSGFGLLRKGETGNGGFVYQLIAGVERKVSPKVTAGLRYKYSVINNIDSSAFDFHNDVTDYRYGQKVDYKANSLLATVRFSF